MSRSLLGISVLVGLVLVPPAHAEKRGDLKGWADREARYLLLDEERAEWKKLETDEQRQAFVDRFWAVRDPDPTTPVNEYQQEIARRVDAANRQFRNEGRPGWLTDRGRILITFGPADEEKEDAAGAIQETGSFGDGGITRQATLGSITWTYHRIPDWDAPPNVQFVFRANDAGVYRLAKEPPVEWKRKPVATGAGGTAARAPGAKRMEPAAAKGDKGDRAQVRDLLLAALHGASPRDLAIEATALTFPVGQKDTLVVVPFTLSLGAAPASPELLFAVFDAGEKSVHAAAVPLGALPTEPRRRSFAFLIPPGSYRIALVGREAGSATALAAGVVPVTVPDYAGAGFRASSVVLARAVEMREATTAKLDQAVDGIEIGNVFVDPVPHNRFSRGATAEVFFMLAGARPGPAGTLDVAAEFRLFQGTELKSKFPAQTLTGPVNDQSMPLAGLDPGEYRLEVELTDRVSGTKSSDSLALVLE